MHSVPLFIVFFGGGSRLLFQIRFCPPCRRENLDESSNKV